MATDDPHPETSSGEPTLIRFSTRDHEPAERFDAFAVRINTMFDIVPPERSQIDFFGSIVSTHTGQMLVSAMETEDFTFARSRQRIMADHLDHFLLRVDLDRPWHEGGRADALTVIDLGQVIEPRPIPNNNISVVLPRRALGEIAPFVESLHGSALTSASALMLGDHLTALMRHADGLEPSVVSTLAEVTPKLISACLKPSVEREQLARRELDLMMLERVRGCIRDNLYNHALDPAFVQKSAGISRATLYRLFEPVGGVAAAIRQARLRQALRDFGAAGSDARISEVAHALGFSSDAHFSRAFKSHYGCSPREARAMLVQGIPVPVTAATRDAERRFPEWLQSL